MKLLESVIQFLSKKEEEIAAPETHCPNCWGRQEYEGQFLKAIHHENIDLNNINEKKGWIQAYAAKQFEGIQLQPKGDVLECTACKLTYEA